MKKQKSIIIKRRYQAQNSPIPVKNGRSGETRTRGVLLPNGKRLLLYPFLARFGLFLTSFAPFSPRFLQSLRLLRRRFGSDKWSKAFVTGTIIL